MVDAPIRAAATLILYRRVPEKLVFLLRRSQRSSFMPNAMVFPGGRVDEADADDLWHDLVVHPALVKGIDSPPQLAHYVAAARETFEEAGVLLAEHDGEILSPHCALGARVFGSFREQLNGGLCDFLSLVRDNHLKLRLDDMSYFSRWVTPQIEKRRFDARFFVAELPPEQAATADDRETTCGAWMRPSDAIAAYEAGDIELAPPTLRILLTLAADWTALQRLAAGASEPMAPQAKRVDGELHLVLPGDRDYDPPGDSINRVIRRDSRWISKGSGA